jgi:hypothetical protein
VIVLEGRALPAGEFASVVCIFDVATAYQIALGMARGIDADAGEINAENAKSREEL